MSTTPRPRSRLIVATLAVALAALLAAGCSGGGSDSGQETTSTTTHTPPKAQQWDPDDAPTTTEPTGPTPATSLPESAGQLDRSDPEQLAQAAIKIWFTWDTGVDDGPNDATARTAPLLTAKFAGSLLATGSNSPGGQWLTWAAQHAVVTPTWRLLPDQGAPHTADRKYFVYEVTQTARTPDGKQIGQPVVTSAWVICVRNGDGLWEVSQLAQR